MPASTSSTTRSSRGRPWRAACSGVRASSPSTARRRRRSSRHCHRARVEILDNIAKGMSQQAGGLRAVAQRADRQNHMSSILRKLSVNDRTQAVVYAMMQAGSGSGGLSDRGCDDRWRRSVGLLEELQRAGGAAGARARRDRPSHPAGTRRSAATTCVGTRLGIG
jgi:hypothetical protein